MGKTPFALLLSLLLRRKNINVIALDFNSLNPDFYEIMKRVYTGKLSVITEVNGERFSYPMAIYEATTKSGGKVWVVSRADKYRYIPYPPYLIFDTIIKLKKIIREPTFIIVDTNLNIPAFNIALASSLELAKKLTSMFRDIYFFHIWTPGTLRKAPFGLTMMHEKTEIELIGSTVTTFSRYGIPLFGRNGENIIHIVTPRFFEAVLPDSFRAKILFLLRRIFGGTLNEAMVPIYDERRFWGNLLVELPTAYERSLRLITIRELNLMKSEFDRVVRELITTYRDFAVEADPLDIEIVFFSFILNHAMERATRTMPLNMIIIPFMVRKLVNFVDAMLLPSVLSEDSIIEREGIIGKIFEIWVNKVLLPGKIRMLRE